MHIAQVDELEEEKDKDLVQVVGAFEATKRGISSEVKVHQDDVEPAHREDSVVAKRKERVGFDPRVNHLEFLFENRVF